jgi:hypothetical protein
VEKQEKLALFGPGPWIEEPDEADWARHGILCALRRDSYFGTLNGYVGVRRGHPWFEVSMNSIVVESCSIDVAGTPLLVSKEPTPYWWIGFDSLHPRDYIPRLFCNDAMAIITYRDFNYCRNKVDKLADEAHAATHAVNAHD